MKKLFYIISIIAGLYSCDQNLTEGITPQQATPESDEKIPVTFQMIFPDLIDYGTDFVPISRAATDTIKSMITNEYKAIIIKKIENQWFVDTIIKNKPFKLPGSIWSDVTITTSDVAFSPIQIDLRPGTYKMGLFLGVNNTDLNPELKKGFLVSSTPGIVPGQNLPIAVFAHFQGERTSDNDPPVGTYVINKEIFAGSVSFTVSKDPELQSKGINTPLNVVLQRKVSRYRFLLRQTGEPTFLKTPHTAKFILKANVAGNPFCNGLDVLGASYYDPANPLTEISLYETTRGDYYQSSFDKGYYQMAERAGGGGSTTFGPFILMDKPISFDLTVPVFNGQSGGPLYECKDMLSLTFQPNSLISNVFVIREPADSNAERLLLKYVDDPNANQLFDPYYEWNAK